MPKILYEDGDILLLNKPVGWLVQKAAPGDVSLNEWMISYLLCSGQITPGELLTFRPGVCNRLDRNTSGIVAAGKTMAGLQFLSEAFRERWLHKYYTCIAVGEIKEPVLAEGYLIKDGRTNQVRVFSVPPVGEEAFQAIRTGYRPLFIKDGFTYLEVELFTGKTHQIRAQLAGDGHALLGDAKYMDDSGVKLRKKYHIRNQLLHAGRIVFGNIPYGGGGGHFSYLTGMEFTAPEPAEFVRVKKMLGLEGGGCKNVLEFARPARLDARRDD
ncbi:MAG: RluA family pseudouridine synthase [Lachnospiraceae bacterium]|nr:RluA family pseudouridine synthase [Lachnospiraceae bacterium]